MMTSAELIEVTEDYSSYTVDTMLL